MATLMDDEEMSSRSLARLQPHPRDRAILTQVTGLEAGRVCSLQALESTLGRAAECTHTFDEGSLSRVHARVTKEGGDHFITDLASRNGVFVNEQRVSRCALHDGDRVRLGSAVSLRFLLVDEHEEQALKKVYESSVRDGLTGAWNRKHLDERLSAELAFAARHGTPLSVLMLDIDYFKRINDTYGHPAGDDVLRSTVATLEGALRAEDILARYGGEEFVVVARGVDLRSGRHLAERLRAVIEHTPAMHGPIVVPRTISVGVASVACCGESRTGERLLSLADARLYAAKQAGRNRVVAE